MSKSGSRIERQYGQWTAFLDDESYGAYNLDEEGNRRYYETQTGKHQNPIIIAEPHLSFPAPNDLDYVDIHGDPTYPVERIAGVICKRAKEVVHRFNLTNLFNSSDVKFEKDGAELIINGVRWYLRGLFQKDKNRIFGYDGFYGEEKPGEVVIMELADVDF